MSTGSNNSDKRQFLIEERRRLVAKCVARAMTQMEIAEELKISQTTVSDDIRALREMSQQFLFDLGKSDLVFCYKQCLDGIDDVTREAWKIYDVMTTSGTLSNSNVKIALECLKIVIQAKESKHKLLSEGPSILAVNTMSKRIDEIEENIKQVVR